MEPDADRDEVLATARQIIDDELWSKLRADADTMNFMSTGRVEHMLAYWSCSLWPDSPEVQTMVEAIWRLDDWKRETGFYPD